MRSAALAAVGAAVLLAATGSPAQAARYHRCHQNVLPPNSLSYRSVTALRTTCSTTEDLVYAYAEEVAGGNLHSRITIGLITRKSDLDWVCKRRFHYIRDGGYSTISCAAVGGHRVKFRGYS